MDSYLLRFGISAVIVSFVAGLISALHGFNVL